VSLRGQESSEPGRVLGAYAKDLLPVEATTSIEADLAFFVAPDGWESRTIEFAAPGAAPARARCLESRDCVVAELVAGREKDRTFAAAVIREGLAEPETLITRIRTLSGVDAGSIDRLEGWVRGLAGRSAG